MDVWVTTDVGPTLIPLTDVLYVQPLNKTLISLKKLAREGYRFRLDKDIYVTTPFGHTFLVPQRDEDDNHILFSFDQTDPRFSGREASSNRTLPPSPGSWSSEFFRVVEFDSNTQHHIPDGKTSQKS